MGNSTPTPTKRSSPAIAAAADKFDTHELESLVHIFRDLARRSPDRATIDRKHFLEFFPLPGLHGEQLFKAFDTKDTGVIDLEEFLTGLAVSCRGTKEEKIRFVFGLYDLTGDGAVSKSELQALLNHVPRSLLRCNHITAAPAQPTPPPPPPAGAETGPQRPVPPGGLKRASSFDQLCNVYTNDDFADKAFHECDLNKDGKLSFEQFRMWLDRTPRMLQFFQDFLPVAPERPLSAHSLDDLDAPPKNRRESLRRSISGPAGTASADVSTHARSRSKSPTSVGLRRSPNSTGQLRGPILDSATSTTRAGVTMEGELYKYGKNLGLKTARYCALAGNVLYMYGSKSDIQPRNVLYLGGCHIEKLEEKAGGEARAATPRSRSPVNIPGFTSDRPPSTDGPSVSSPALSPAAATMSGFRILHLDAELLGEKPTTFYATTPMDRDVWVDALLAAAGFEKIDARYDFGEELGSGRFATVRIGTERSTGARFAVKCILKTALPKDASEKEARELADEREAMRREIAVMRLVRHPHVLPLHAVYEDRTTLYLVTPLTGGELLRRLAGRPRFSEVGAHDIMAPVLGAVAYLHQLGIAHCDLKPENILCDDEEDEAEPFSSIRLSDFGLSRMLRPTEKLKEAAGTIEYCAPEVFLRRGYGTPADMWSVGVIMFLLLRGRLPFSGETKGETITNILGVDMSVDGDDVWLALSADARELIQRMLTKDATQRITAKEALEHPWMVAQVAAKHAAALAAEEAPAAATEVTETAEGGEAPPR